MKIYNILATVIVEDSIKDSDIAYLLNEKFNEDLLDFDYATNHIFHYELKETIDYPDPPDNDEDGNFYDQWMKKSQEVIERIQMGMRNP